MAGGDSMADFSSWYFGMDGQSVTPFPTCGTLSKDFYIGRLGGETTPGGGPFVVATAEAVGALRTFAYWDVAGPGPRTGTAAFNWGVDQANAFMEAWALNQYVGSATLFGDFEGPNGGWTNGNGGPNFQTLQGFLETLTGGNFDFVPGVYITQDNWDNWFGQTYISPTPFVYWLADSLCKTCSDAESFFNSTISGSSYDRGGYKVMIWQYAINTCSNSGNKDLDITPYSGFLNGRWNPTAA